MLRRDAVALRDGAEGVAARDRGLDGAELGVRELAPVLGRADDAAILALGVTEIRQKGLAAAMADPLAPRQAGFVIEPSCVPVLRGGAHGPVVALGGGVVDGGLFLFSE